MAIEFKEEVDKFRAGSYGFGHDYDLIGSRKVQTKAKAGLYVYPSDDGECDLPATAVAVTEGKGGVATYMPDRRANADGFEWQVDDYLQYLERGHIVGITEEAVSDGEDVYVRFASGTGTQLGAFRNDADGATLEVTVITTADAAVLEVELNGIQLSFVSGAAETAAAKATAFAAYVDGLAAFGAAAVGAVVTITPVSGTVVLGEVSPAEILTAAEQATCAKLPGAHFVGDATSGLALISYKK